MILLTGATGFLGSRLLRELLKENYKVCCVRRTASKCDKEQESLPNCTWVNIDKVKTQTIFVKGDIDVIIHCATNYGKSTEDIMSVYNSNLSFPLTLLEDATKYGCKYFINTDTFFSRALHGWCDLSKKVYMDAYVKSKYFFANFVRENIKKMNLVFINMQLEHIYGPNDSAEKFVSFLLENLQNNVPALELTEGTQIRDWTYIDDVISAYMTILSKRNEFCSGNYYHFEVGTGIGTSLRRFVEIAKEISGSRTRLEFGKRNIHKNELEQSHADNTGLRNLGWEPCFSVEAGLSKIIKEYII